MTDLESALKTAPGKKILFYEGGGEALGPRILRTETAPLAALSVLMYITGNMQ